MSSSTPGYGPRRRRPGPSPPVTPVPSGTRQINAAPLLETAKPGIDPDAPLTLSRVIGVTVAIAHATVPTLVSWGLTMGLIFGGCCSNVFTLEKIVKEEPDSGNLITFVQFLITALFTWPAHFAVSRPPFFLKPRAIPLVRWLPNIILFFTVNLLNNYAFGYNISVPVHIILRSGGSATTMLIGFLWGKRYSRVQILSVMMLTVGIIVAAMADAQSKGKSTSGPARIDPSFVVGLFILALAQVLSAVMGLYTQITYSTYGTHWHENLFYSHFLSLPLFLPFFPSLIAQFRQFFESPLVQLSPLSFEPFPPPKNADTNGWPSFGSIMSPLSKTSMFVPKQLLMLIANALTQYACIRGVNFLGARTSALGVTIVLNIRKLVSLFLSIWLFGNRLPPGVLTGAAVVFTSAGVWAWEGQRKGGTKAHKKG